MQFSNITTAVIGLALVTLALVGFAAIGAAETVEMENETVSFDESENVTVEVDWNDSAPTDATASVTFYNASEFKDDRGAATVVLEDSIAADPGNTTSATYTTDDGLEDGTDYQIVVEADDTEAEQVVVDDGGLFGGPIFGADGSPGFGAGVAIVAIAAAAMIARRGS